MSEPLKPDMAGISTGGIFTIESRDSACAARTGTLCLPHGEVRTPVFMPVGTNGTVKAMSADDLSEIGFQIILSNTYHLYLRPGAGVIEGAGGLHRFINWDRNILTDSGGFQVFSLAPFRKITPDGVKFRSHIDGSSHFLSPEQIVEIQAMLGSDIQMQLDLCTSWGASRKEAEKALETTTAWMRRAKKRWEEIVKRNMDLPVGGSMTTPMDFPMNFPISIPGGTYRGLLFPIVQGNFFEDLRKQSVEEVTGIEPPGIAIGGLSVGEPGNVFIDYLAFTAALLPQNLPRYIMGIGSPDYILAAIENGIDMFDCVFPTRNARNGHVFTRRGPFALKKAENRLDFSPIDEECGCKVCRAYSRAYLRHLFKTGEILCSMLASYHNLYFLQNLVTEAGAAIRENRFTAFKKDFLSGYCEGEA